MPATTPTSTTRTPRYVGQIGRDLASPAGIALDDVGALWVADTFAGVVHRYESHGLRTDVIGRGVLTEPRDVAVGGDHLFVADSARDCVEVFERPRGKHVATLARGVVGRPRGVAVDADGHVLVSDVDGNRVARLDPSSGAVLGSITTDVHIPHGLHVDGTTLYVVSSSRQYDGDGGAARYVGDQPTTTYGDGQHSTFGAQSNPAQVALERDGTVLVSVPDYGFVQRFAADGTFVDEFGTSGGGLLRQPLGLAVRADGEVLVADAGNRRIARYARSAR